MRHLQMLPLRHDGVRVPEIASTLGVARSTIQDNLGWARAAGIGWPLPAGRSDEILEQRHALRIVNFRPTWCDT